MCSKYLRQRPALKSVSKGHPNESFKSMQATIRGGEATKEAEANKVKRTRFITSLRTGTGTQEKSGRHVPCAGTGPLEQCMQATTKEAEASKVPEKYQDKLDKRYFTTHPPTPSRQPPVVGYTGL
jgi:hypothetical protein